MSKKIKFKKHVKKEFESNVFLKWIKNKWKLLLCIIIAGYIYSAIHEIIHYSVFVYFGYFAEFCWTCIPTQVKILTPLNEVLKSHYFLSVVSPYLLSIILLTCLLSIYLLTKKRVLMILAIPPFLDTFINMIVIPISYFAKTGNDFLNLFSIGIYLEAFAIMFAPILLFSILWFNYHKEKRKGKEWKKKKVHFM